MKDINISVVTTEKPVLPHEQLCPVDIIMDGRLWSSQVGMQWQDVKQHLPLPVQCAVGRVVLLESMIPEIRALACHIAMITHHGMMQNKVMVDAADWLAARCYVLGIQLIALPPALFSILNLVNERLTIWGKTVGLEVAKVLPILATHSLTGPVMSAWSVLPLNMAAQPANSLVTSTLAVRSKLKQRTQALHKIWQDISL